MTSFIFIFSAYVPKPVTGYLRRPLSIPCRPSPTPCPGRVETWSWAHLYSQHYYRIPTSLFSSMSQALMSEICYSIFKASRRPIVEHHSGQLLAIRPFPMTIAHCGMSVDHSFSPTAGYLRGKGKKRDNNFRDQCPLRTHWPQLI